MGTQIPPLLPPPHKTSPNDFFLHLLGIVTLYASAVSLGTVLFQIINLALPDLLEASQYYYVSPARDILRNSLSFLIVMFPVYAFTAWHLHKSYLADTAKVHSRIRRWLIYFTLFAAALVIIFSLVSLVNHLLNGELTLRFGLKLLTVLGIAAAVGWFYVWELRRYKSE